MDAYNSMYVGFCSRSEHPIGINISWENNIVTGYDCKYPNCLQDCKLLKEFPIGFKSVYSKDPT